MGHVNGYSWTLDVQESETFSRAVVARLKVARQERGLSQAALAKMAGVSRTGITMVESGERRPTLMFVHALAGAMGLTLSEVISSVEK